MIGTEQEEDNADNEIRESTDWSEPPQKQLGHWLGRHLLRHTNHGVTIRFPCCNGWFASIAGTTVPITDD